MRRLKYFAAAFALAPVVTSAQVVEPSLPLRLSNDMRAGHTPAAKRVPATAAEPLLLQRTAQIDAAPAAAAAATPAPIPQNTPERYVDRVMDERTLDTDAALADAKADADIKGRRFLAVDYKLYTRDASTSGRSVEQGTGIRYRRETADYGELYLDAEFRHYHPATSDTLPAQTLKSRITLSQYRYALTETKQMDNALGVVRNNANPLVSSSFRIQLPSSILQGATSVIYEQNSEWRFSGGQLGKLTGVAVQQFDTTNGTLTGAGYTRNLNANWSASTQLYSLTGHDTVADHQSVA